ncbi:hypothetical protein F7R05_27655 [Pseudomonas koreensis]|nr:hypothetical protein F7R05_27655 [Pseudomonas koreensis]
MLTKTRPFRGSRFFLIVPTLCVGMPLGTLRVPNCELHSFAARGSDLISHPSTRRDPALD